MKTDGSVVRMGALLLGIGVLSGGVGCGPSLYELPPPPPQEEWVDLDATVEESEEEQIRRFLDAKRTAIATFSALSTRDWDTALGHMSQETRNFLEDASDGNGAASVLDAGKLMLSGREIEFDPVTDFFIADLEDIVDEFPGQSDDTETKRRKELYAMSKGGPARKILVIYEGDAWRFHSPFIRTSLLNPAPAEE